METLTSAQVWQEQVVPLFSNQRGQERCLAILQPSPCGEMWFYALLPDGGASFTRGHARSHTEHIEYPCVCVWHGRRRTWGCLRFSVQACRYAKRCGTLSLGFTEEDSWFLTLSFSLGRSVTHWAKRLLRLQLTRNSPHCRGRASWQPSAPLTHLRVC